MKSRIDRVLASLLWKVQSPLEKGWLLTKTFPWDCSHKSSLCPLWPIFGLLPLIAKGCSVGVPTWALKSPKRKSGTPSLSLMQSRLRISKIFWYFAPFESLFVSVGMYVAERAIGLGWQWTLIQHLSLPASFRSSCKGAPSQISTFRLFFQYQATPPEVVSLCFEALL